MSKSGGDRGQSLWRKLAEYAATIGRPLVEQILAMYFCSQDPDTPRWARGVIAGALAYFILPLDAIADFVPGVGLADDAGAIAAALGMVLVHIKPEHREQARARTDEWFGPAGDG
jgi:uncharacterized membrane protein YkvA (DUF1232 family)